MTPRTIHAPSLALATLKALPLVVVFWLLLVVTP